MFKRQSLSRFQVQAVLLFFFILAVAYPARAADTGSLPAQNWNRENLQRIKGLAAEPLTFTVMGDNRDNPEIFGKVLKQADNDPGLTFAIHLGDMVHKVDLDQYRIFFNEVRQNYRQPLVTVIGNHELYGERGLELYREIFGPDYYSFQVGGNYFIVVDDAAKEVMTPEQLSWLEAELRKAQAYKTRLVFLHVPLFDPSGSPKPHCLPPEAAARLLALFKKYQVSHVFAAHLHGYYAGAWDGLPYTITGGAGAPLYGKDTRHDFYHYAKVTIAGGKVKVQVRPLADGEGK
jgi:serine/threonine-protein phosphatase CPPED1